MTWTRRRVLKTSGAAAAAPVLPGCTTGTSWSAPDCTLDEVVQSFFAEPYDAFVPLARWLGEGLGESELYAAAMNAAARWVWPGDDMHAAMVVRACQLLGARLAEPERWVPLFWAWDQVHGAAGSDDLAPHDARGTSSTDDAQAGLEESWDRWDPAAADAYAAELYAVGGRPAVLEPLARYSLRNHDWLGHKAIWVAYALRSLDDFGWGCGEWVVRSLARTIASQEESADTSAYEANLARLEEVPDGWRDGTDQPERVPELLAALRSRDQMGCVDALLDCLHIGVSPRTCWTAMALHAVEQGLRWGEGSYSVHHLDTLNALRHLQDLSDDEDTARLSLLQGAAWSADFQAFQSGDPKLEEGLDTLAPAEGETPTLDACLEAIGGSVSDVARMLLAWQTAGGSALDLIDAWAPVAGLRQANADQHRFKFHAALLEEAEACLPEWQGRLLLGIPLRSPSATTPLWERHEEALEIIAGL